jgi:hypothetical protein
MISERTAPAATPVAMPEPWIGYDSQPVDRIQGFLTKSPPTQAQKVRDYECAGSNRAEVIAAADKRLGALPA